MKKWVLQNKKNVFKSPLFSIESLSCRHPEKNVDHDFYVIDMTDWINIVAITDAGRFIMVRQHRLGTNECTLETPAGLIEANEPPEKAAGRELLEETGYTAGEIVLLKKLSVNPAIINNHLYFYLATGCVKSSAQNLDPAEDIEVLDFSHEEIISMIHSGKINHSIIITAFSLYFMSPHANKAAANTLYYGVPPASGH